MENIRGKTVDNLVKTNPNLAYLTSVENMQIVLGEDCQKYINIVVLLETIKQDFSLDFFHKSYGSLSLAELNTINEMVMDDFRNTCPEEFNFLASCAYKLHSPETMANMAKAYDAAYTAVSEEQPPMEQKNNDKGIGD